MMVRHVKQLAAEATGGFGRKQRKVVAGAVGPIAEERTNDRLHENRPAHFVGIAARIRDADQRISGRGCWDRGIRAPGRRDLRA